MSRDFLNQLKNYEKLRNHNVFQNYTLNDFAKTLEIMGLNRQNHNSIQVSVVGTNGKGSVTYFLSELAQKNFQIRVGNYTSPHLLHETERIQVNGKEITYSEIEYFLNSQSTETLKALENLSYFEFFTLLAIYYFQKTNCDLNIYEAGMGGRLDATKLAQAEYLVVTKIGLDHTNILGNTKELILQEKLQITSKNTKAIFYFPQEENLNQLILNYGEKEGIPVYSFQTDFHDSNVDYLSFNLMYSKFILEYIYKTKITNLEVTNPKGRMEVIQREPMIIFDVGHNPDAIQNLLLSLERKYENVYWDILLGCLPDKDIIEITNLLQKWTYTKDLYFVTDPPFVKPELPNIKTYQKWTKKNPTILTGSFRLYELIINFL